MTRPRCGTALVARGAVCAAAGRPVSAPGTRCAPRWATPCTVRTSARTISPVQARVGWAVGWRKPSFFGRDALLAEKAAGTGTGRPGGCWRWTAACCAATSTVLDADGNRIGETTSGTFSPTLGQGIGLALIDTVAGVADGDEIAVDVRGRRLRVRVVKPPFVPAHVR